MDYDDFCMVFIHASRGLIDLQLEGDTLLPIHNFTNESQYEAYNRLVKPIDVGFSREELFVGLDEVYAKIVQTLRINGENFSFGINPKTVIFTMDKLRPILQQKFLLPDDWSFSRYSISDFRQVFHAIFALAYLQYSARMLAAQLGCIGLGFANCLFIAGKDELLRRVIRYTGLSNQIVSDIINDLTLGTNAIPPEQADPALQPLILLTDERYVIMPHLWVNNAAERNFVVLLNKLPKDKKIYLSLVQQKESLMRKRINEAVTHQNWRIYSYLQLDVTW